MTAKTTKDRVAEYRERLKSEIMIKVEVYLPNNENLDKNKKRLSRHIKTSGGIYNPR